MLSLTLTQDEGLDYLDEVKKVLSSYASQTFDSMGNHDLFAFIFFHLSRYEEYLPSNRDHHDRYQSTASVLSDYLHLPVVDYALLYFMKLIKSLTSKQLTLKKLPALDITFDIDHAWKYKHKGLFLSMGGILKSLFKLEIQNILKRFEVILGKRVDPYDLDLWQTTYRMEDVGYFFLLSNRRKYDKGFSIDNVKLQQLMNDLSEVHEIGIHPGYDTYQDSSLLKQQVNLFKRILGSSPRFSRQHYLQFKLPETYRNLLSLNSITCDYTMGYADRLGFRAGTSREFFWFDILENTSTNLLIRPFQIMDVTLKNYMKLNTNESLDAIANFQSILSDTSGTLRVIWHNSSPPWESEWSHYKPVIDLLLSKNET